jgi:diadenosine tetraphosphate (Ap4A) HIT family hydrolase
MSEPASDRASAGCPFCRLLHEQPLIVSTATVAAFPDAFPLTTGHTLVVPRRHVSSFWDLTGAEVNEVMEMAFQLRTMINDRFSPDGYNLGVNIGPTAGQTVAHAHLHVIPRYAGDSPDPRGGVRWILPERAPYWGASSGPANEPAR